jgi:hypothetical protein
LTPIKATPLFPFELHRMNQRLLEKQKQSVVLPYSFFCLSLSLTHTHRHTYTHTHTLSLFPFTLKSMLD